MKKRAVTKGPDDTRLMIELGQSGLERMGGRIYEEFLRQLTGALALKAYREMSENDPVVGAMFYALEALIRGTAWNVEPGGQERGDQEAADFVKTLPDDMSHGWKAFISEWMATPTYGFGPFEIVWKRRDGWTRDPSTRSRHDDGRIGVRKLAVRHPSTLDQWLFDESGGVQGMVQRAAPQWKPIAIPIEKLLLFTVGQRKGSPEGTSLLRKAFTAYQRKRGIEGIEAIGIERDLAGLPVAWVPPQLLDADASAAEAATLTEIKKIVRNVRRDEQEGIVFPLAFGPDGQKLYDFTLLTTGGRRNFDTSTVIERYDRRIAMTILADVILLGHEKVGSFALASSKTQLFAVGVGALLDGIEEVLNRHLVPRVLELNGFPLRNMPRFTHGDIENVDLAELGAYVTALAGAGMPLFPTEDGALERQLLGFANLPSDKLAVDPMVTVPDDIDTDADPGAPAGPGDGGEVVVGDEAFQLNGAQIRAALDVIRGLTTTNEAEKVEPVVAVELLTAVGVRRERAQRIVDETVSGRPPTVTPRRRKPPEPEPAPQQPPRVRKRRGIVAVLSKAIEALGRPPVVVTPPPVQIPEPTLQPMTLNVHVDKPSPKRLKMRRTDSGYVMEADDE